MAHYQGDELKLFANALKWKGYVADALGPHIGSNVLEVGAGLGTTTRSLRLSQEGHWTCLEPDPDMAAKLVELAGEGLLGDGCDVVNGLVADLPVSGAFDTVLYVDVLEHIEDDAAELRGAVPLMAVGGRLIVLSPAYQSLFTSFDAAIGHYRRYTKASLAALTPPNMVLECSFYLDSVGCLASLGNRLFLRSGMPSESQIAFWDRVLVQTSRCVDPLVRFGFGRSVICVWEKI